MWKRFRSVSESFSDRFQTISDRFQIVLDQFATVFGRLYSSKKKSIGQGWGPSLADRCADPELSDPSPSPLNLKKKQEQNENEWNKTETKKKANNNFFLGNIKETS